MRTDKGPKLARRHFEVCVFAALAAALKAGDVAVEGSDAYADYRYGEATVRVISG